MRSHMLPSGSSVIVAAQLQLLVIEYNLSRSHEGFTGLSVSFLKLSLFLHLCLQRFQVQVVYRRALQIT